MKLHPAFLWIGQNNVLLEHAKQFLKQIFCANKTATTTCNNCPDCSKIDLQQHHNIRWLVPENQYTVAQLEIIFKTIIFALEPDQHFFFVLERADLLNNSCANSLLKSLEEPPAGYHFLLLSPRRDGLLPTIISRCVLREFNFIESAKNSILFDYFKDEKKLQFTEFAKELEKSKIPERDIIDFIDQLYFYWATIYRNNLQLEVEGIMPNESQKLISKAQKIIDILDKSRQNLPMPGSSKTFLKNLYLQCQLVNLA